MRNTQIVRAGLAAHATPFNPALHQPALHRLRDRATVPGVAALNWEITRQATTIGDIDDCKNDHDRVAGTGAAGSPVRGPPSRRPGARPPYPGDGLVGNTC